MSHNIMNIQECEAKLKELELKAKENPSKKPIYRLQYRSLLAAKRLYLKLHPTEK